MDKRAGKIWKKLPMSLSELCIDTTLRCGQSFRWRQCTKDTWACGLKGRILLLRQDPEYLYYSAIYPAISSSSSTIEAKTEAESDTGPGASTMQIPSGLPSPPRTGSFFKTQSRLSDAGDDDVDDDQDDNLHLIKHYFNLGYDVQTMYKQWINDDANFRSKAENFSGIRILQQDAWETLVAFICSSNNNISRIHHMITQLCENYGNFVGDLDIDGNIVHGRHSQGATPYHDFPSPQALLGPEVENHLRKLGFGYRAKYLYYTARAIFERGSGWLEALHNPEKLLLHERPRRENSITPFSVQPTSAGEFQAVGGRLGYRHARTELMKLSGVGPKVADCVCLMGLGWGEAVPVDTHVWQIANRDYGLLKRSKTKSGLTKNQYDVVADHFRNLWGKEAGWAQSVLFTANLPSFSHRLVESETKITTTTTTTIVTTGKRQADEDPETSSIENATTQTIENTKRRRVQKYY